MKKYSKMMFRWAGIGLIVALIAGLTSLIITKRIVWITLKCNEKG